MHRDKGVRRRSQILDATFALVASDPWSRPSLRAIARELDLETPHLLHYFATKDDLFQAVIARWNEQSQARDVSLGWLDRLPKTLAYNSGVPGMVKLYTEMVVASADPSHPSHSFFSERFAMLRMHLSAEIETLKLAGTVAETLDSRRTASQIIGYSDGLQMQWLVDQKIDMADEMTRFIRLLLSQTENPA